MLTNVAKELKDNQHILKSLQSTAMPPIQKNSIVPEKQASKVGDTLEIILMAPFKSDFFASTTEIKVTPTNHHWNGGSITSVSSFLTSSSRCSSQCQLLHLYRSRSFPSPAMCSGHPQEGQVESWEGRGPCGGEVQLEVAWPWARVSKLVPFWLPRRRFE